MRRGLFNLLAVLLIFLFVLAAAEMARSFFVKDGWIWREHQEWPSGRHTEIVIHRDYEITCSRGGIRFIHHYSYWEDDLGGESLEQPAFEWIRNPAEYYPAPTDSILVLKSPKYKGERLGFGFAYRNDFDYRVRAVTLPLAVPITIFGAVASFVLRRIWRNSHRLEKNLCLQCGYDLRASPERCPECGTPRLQ